MIIIIQVIYFHKANINLYYPIICGPSFKSVKQSMELCLFLNMQDILNIYHYQIKYFITKWKILLIAILGMQPQKQQKPKQLPQNKKNLLFQLLKRKRQRDADQKLGQLAAMPQHEDLLLALKHNKFGGFCLQANDLQKAQMHFNKALQTITNKYKIPFSNVQMNIGNLYGQKKDYKEAIVHYNRVLQLSPYNPNNSKAQLPQDCPIDIQKYSCIIYSAKFNAQSAYTDAHTNIAVMYIQVDQIDKAFEYCQKSLQLQPNNQQSVINFTDILRQLGRKQQAIKRTWDQIIQYTRKEKPDYNGFQAIKIKNWEKVPYEGEKKINVLCVKWGTRYPASYVNKLYAGIKRHTSWEFDFYCFTEDATGLYPQIKIKQLEQGWKKWWGKVTLFKDNGIQGRKFYIDLDMIITGNLDEIFGYAGQFITLRTGDLACEKNHKQGYNSSVMIWNDDILIPIYNALKQNFENINKCIVRFDFWLEMTIANADYMQVVYPGQVVDFLADAKQKLPQNSRIVCFARKPKPQDYPAEWVKQHWIQ